MILTDEWCSFIVATIWMSHHEWVVPTYDVQYSYRFKTSLVMWANLNKQHTIIIYYQYLPNNVATAGEQTFLYYTWNRGENEVRWSPVETGGNSRTKTEARTTECWSSHCGGSPSAVTTVVGLATRLSDVLRDAGPLGTRLFRGLLVPNRR
jgi:hypothetical protein